MARKLKTYTTSAGFFDLAIAAPSMKAALEAWGSKANLFQQGFAKESKDAAVIAATMAKPGVVLRRPVGSTGTFSEHAELPKNLSIAAPQRTPARRPARETRRAPAAVEDRSAREAALAFEKEQKRRDSEHRRQEAAQARVRQRRDRAIAAAQSALDEARSNHEARMAEMERERAALERRTDAEHARWNKKKEELEEALRRARSVSYLRPV